jgi:GNAT superfamily N-acetyltransferase
MNDDDVRCGMWANDLRLLDRLGPNRSGYMFAETSTQVAELAAAMNVPAPVVRERLERGCRVFVARSRTDAVAAWLWVSTAQERAEPLCMDLHFAPDECYGWNAGTLPQHRGHGLFTALLRYAGWRMAQQGCRWMWGGILDSNLASRRSCIGAGFRPILRLTAVHEPQPTRIECWPADYADERLVERALHVLGDHTDGSCSFGRPTTEHTITGRPLALAGPVAAAMQGKHDA